MTSVFTKSEAVGGGSVGNTSHLHLLASGVGGTESFLATIVNRQVSLLM